MKEEEKAREMVEFYLHKSTQDNPKMFYGIEEAITDAIRTAKLEGYKSAWEETIDINKSYQKGWNEAIEEAARIAESFPGITVKCHYYHGEENALRHKRIATAIRNKLKKEK